MTENPRETEVIASPQPGQVLDGKYRIETVLGIGGMGIVVSAFHLKLEGRVAIKFLKNDALADRESIARFEREARAAAKIRNDHVVRIIDVGTLDEGAPYIVMELLDGEDLASHIEKDGRTPIGQAVDWVLQACEALAEAHALGIVHRDLKPGNLFLTRRRDGTTLVKVLDFGVSKVAEAPGAASSLRMTKTGAVVGSPLYMAPEQMASSRNVDVRADIWALGLVVYELVTGMSPFRAASVPELCFRIMQSPATPLRFYLPEAPVEFERVVMRCLERDRERRFANVAELSIALAQHGSQEAQASLRRIAATIGDCAPRTPLAQGAHADGNAVEGLLSPRAQTGRVSAASAWGTTNRRALISRKTRPIVWVSSAVGAGLVMAGLGAIQMTRSKEPPSSAASAQLGVSSAKGRAVEPSIGHEPSIEHEPGELAVSNPGPDAATPTGGTARVAPAEPTRSTAGKAAHDKPQKALSALPPAAPTPAAPMIPSSLLDDRR